MTYQRLWNDSPVLSLIVAEICSDRTCPINIRVARAARSLRAIQRSAKGLLSFVLQPGHQVVNHLAHDLPGRLPGLFGNCGSQRDEVSYQVNVSLKRGEELRFQHQQLQVQS